MKFSLTLFMGLVAATASASAAPVLYNINFTQTIGSGPAPTAGSFLYDATTQTFSTFTVQWNGLTFDLTGSANSPSLAGTCNTAAPDAADYLTYLSGSGCVGTAWQTASNVSSVLFRLGGGGRSRFAYAESSIATDPVGDAGGAFSIESTAAGVPEPSSWVLILGSGAWLAWQVRRKPGTGRAA